MNIGDRSEVIVVGKGEVELPSETGLYTQKVHYDIHRDAVILNAPELVLFDHKTFLQFVDEMRRARQIIAAIQPLDPHGLIHPPPIQEDE